VAAVETLIFRARRALRLKASSVRVLSVVQLPASLAQLLEGGGGVAVGGSAVVGYGFLFKATVAVVAGVVATTIAAGDQVRRAQAEPSSPVVAAPPWSTGADLAFISNRVRAKAQVAASRSAARIPAEPVDVVDTAALQATQATSGSTSSSSATTIGNTSAAVSQAASTVTSAVSSVAASVPSITVPQLPPLPPVQLPPPPPPPPLP
jgi:hypothetical protein